MKKCIKKSLAVLMTAAMVISSIGVIGTKVQATSNDYVLQNHTVQDLMKEYGVIAFDDTTIKVHFHGNFLVNHLRMDANAGLRTIYNTKENFYFNTADRLNANISDYNSSDSDVLYTSSKVVKSGNENRVRLTNGTMFKIDRPTTVVSDDEIRADGGYSKFVDISDVKNKFITYNQAIAEQEEKGSSKVSITKDQNNRRIKVGSGENYCNIPYDDFKKYPYNEILFDFSNYNNDDSLVINIDLKDQKDVIFPSLILRKNGVSLSNTEENYIKKYNRVYFNFYDSSKKDKQYTGNITFNGRGFGTIIAPSASVVVPHNWDGTIVANDLEIGGQFHRVDGTSIPSVVIKTPTTEATTETTEEVTTEATTEKVTTEATTEKVTTEATTEKVTTEATTEKVTTEATTEKVTTEATTEKVTTEATTEKVTTEATTEKVTTEATTEKVTTEATTEKVTTEATTEKVTTEATTEKATTEATTEKATTEKATEESVTTEITTEKVTTEATTESNVSKETGDLSITIKDETTDEPVPGAKVEVTSPDGEKTEYVTNEEGKVELDKVPEGDYTVEVTDVPDGYDVTTSTEVNVTVQKDKKVKKTVSEKKTNKQTKKDAKTANKMLQFAADIKTGDEDLTQTAVDSKTDITQTGAANNKTVSKHYYSKLKSYKKKHKKQSKEIAAWITIAGTKIDYPVMYSGTKNNTKYLQKNINGRKDTHGMLFASYITPKRKITYNNVIYGHNMKDGTMFTDLTKYANKSFYKKNKYVKIYTQGYNYSYEVVEVIRISCKKGSKDRMIYEKFAQLNNKKTFKKWQKQVAKNREYKCSGKYKSTDKLLMLSTCEYEKENGRFILICKQVKCAKVK